MIRTAKFENFKGLKDVEVTFDSRFTVLVGPNGTGKTSVLEGIDIISDLAGGLIPTTSKSWKRFKSASHENGKMVVRLENDAGYGWQLEDPVWDGSRESWVQTGFSKLQTIGDTSVRYPPTHAPSVVLGASIRPSYQASRIASATVNTKTPPEVERDGHGVSSLMAYLKLRDDEIFARVENELRDIIPHIRKIRLDMLAGAPNRGSGNVFMFDTKDARHVPADQMSDGTLYILALIVAVLGPHRPKTLLIDDIDLRLHPKAQYELVTLLKKFLEEFPDLQIIATSHSPYILDKLEPNEVRVTGLGEDGSVVIAPLTDHPAYEKWKDSMTPGEFWSHTGEEWLKKLNRSTPTS